MSDAVERPLSQTRAVILAAADELFYNQGFRAVGVDATAAKAGVTKKTLYYHFRSKDELFALYLEGQDEPTLVWLQRYAESDGTMTERVVRMLAALGPLARDPKWRGCGFVRATGELADQPGHAAVSAARVHKARLERWIRQGLEAEGREDAPKLAKALMVLVDGTVAQLLLHRNSSYAEAAAWAAHAMLSAGYLPMTRNASTGGEPHQPAAGIGSGT
jgi:AcrR family transcriptional regulator